MKRKTGEQLLRDFAAEDARDMRRMTRKLKGDPDCGYYRAMQAYYTARYNSYKSALDIINSECLWRDE